MKRSKSAEALPGRRRKLTHFLLGAAALYLLFIALKFHRFLDAASVASGDGSFSGGLDRPPPLDAAADVGRGSLHGSAHRIEAHHRKLEDGAKLDAPQMAHRYEAFVHRARPDHTFNVGYGRITGKMMQQYLRGSSGRQRKGNFSELERMAQEAWALGLKAWEEVENYDAADLNSATIIESRPESCPSSTTIRAADNMVGSEKVMFLPCSLVVGSSITVVGTPHQAHMEYVPQLARLREGDGTVMVSQFMVELQGLKAVEGEDPPKIMHLNPRIKGDWSHKPIIEHNTCYRMQWGKALRCDGGPSTEDDETVDDFIKCETWEHADTGESETKTSSWLKRFIGRANKPELKWPFPFVEGKLFVMTIQAGVEGYHINVGGRHVSSFPYRMGFTLEDATGLAIKGDVDIHSVYATSLPTSHPSFSVQQVLEMSERWKSPPLPHNPIQLLIGILSATNHFAERMAIRKTWLQYHAIRSSTVAARFFVALSPRKEVNAALKKEAEYFNDIVILPFMDRYDLVVLKTIAICQFGVDNVTTPYIMKGDDDTFVRVDMILRRLGGVVPNTSLYMGNLNLMHRPLRSGKWAVTFEEWPEEVYPAYANGPGYIISNDIARYVVSQHANQSLRLFKMEDVSMGMWVEEFNSTTTYIQYSHSWKFCQYGCIDNYYTSHYQSPRQMFCLWDKLLRGQAQCCNFR